MVNVEFIKRMNEKKSNTGIREDNNDGAREAIGRTLVAVTMSPGC